MISDQLEIFTHRFAKWAGSASGFFAALLSILVWLVAGVVYGFSQGWESGLTIYIGVITFLMVFLTFLSVSPRRSGRGYKDALVSAAIGSDILR